MPELDAARRTRLLRDLAEPIASQVYFVPEVAGEYEKLGLSQFGDGYFVSRGACLGRAPGQVIAAAFGVFNPAVVVPLVEQGWSKTSAEQVLDARYRGATAALRRIIGEPEGTARAVQILRPALESASLAGRTLFAGLRSLPFPGDPIGQLWRVCDWVRERRGDGHIACWVGAGCDAVEIGLLTELYWGLPLGTYIRTRSWSADEIQAGVERLERKGYVSDGAFTPDGKRLRAEIEAATDRMELDVVAAIGDAFDELAALLEPWTRAILDAKAYPSGARNLDELIAPR